MIMLNEEKSVPLSRLQKILDENRYPEGIEEDLIELVYEYVTHKFVTDLLEGPPPKWNNQDRCAICNVMLKDHES